MATEEPGEQQAPAPAAAGDRRGWRRTLRNVVAVPVLAVAGYLGGLAATSLWPITLETEHYAAQARVAPSLERASTVHNPTVFGDIDLQFSGPIPAPGVETRIQVKEEITELFTRGSVDVAAVTPDAGELRRAVTGGLLELSWKFGLGVLLTELLIVGMWGLGRKGIRWRTAVPILATGGVLAVAVPAVGAVTTYRTDQLLEYRTTGLLGTVTDNADLFADITQQAEVGSQYVRNLLALSAALQQEFVPVEASTDAAARFLLVSDVHGMNYYALMRRVVEEQQIDAVIDTGDLLNFGRAQEGELAGIYDGIESLGVPYLFVRGNHDATSRTDENVLERMARVPNVILLEPTAGQYQEVVVNGVRVSGFNDWKHFADRAEDPAAIQAESASRFREVLGDTPSDIVVSHEPYAVDRVPTAGVRVNGHMHVADLVGTRIQAGSFTGGGLVNHFQQGQSEDDETAGELVGVPYAFDVLSFDATCSVQSLTRYAFRDLVSGRPEYNEVSLVNGRQIARPAEEGRDCGPAGAPEVRPLPLPGEGGDDEGEGGGPVGEPDAEAPQRGGSPSGAGPSSADARTS